jgi:GNAT superfamily N-acetyltransferase
VGRLLGGNVTTPQFKISTHISTGKGMAAMIIRKADSKDIPGIAKVHVDSWRTTYKGIVPNTFLDSLSYENREQIWKRGIKESHVYIAEDEDGQIVGFATGGKERTGKYEAFKGELYAIYLLEEQQGKGLGQKLFMSVVHDLKDKKLNSLLIWALEANPACRFYERLGGKKIDTAEIEIDGQKLDEIAFGWDDLSGSGLFVKDGVNEKVEKNS